MAGPQKSGLEGNKLHPKLRMICNGDSVVNTIRSEHSGCIRTAEGLRQRVPQLRDDGATPLRVRRLTRPLKKGKLKQVPAEVDVNLFVSLSDDSSSWRGVPGVSASTSNLRTVTLPLDQVRDLAADPFVSFLEPGETLRMPQPIVASDSVDPPRASLRRIGSTNQHHHGRDVLIGIIDVQGFDFAHPDFLDSTGGTRFARIWDQEGDTRPPPSRDGRGFDYGAEFTKAHLDAAIRDSPGLGVPPQEIERQSQRAEASHGTHVASIAAGNRGICRKDQIAAVLIGLTEEDVDRRRSFYDSTRIAHAVEYLTLLAIDLGYEQGLGRPLPLSINISLGTNGHAHDASSAVSRWLDSALSTPGRCVSVAAGNSGKEAPEFAGDLGYVMGRIHTSGHIEAAGLNHDIAWEVVGNGRVDLSENELEIWHAPQDRLSVAIKPPGATEWIGPVRAGEFIENQQLADGSFISIYNELYHAANGANYISLFLSPLLSEQGIVGIPSGRWTVRLHGDEIRDGRFDAWIERDDPRRLGRLGDREAWRFPSYFAEGSYVDRSTVSSLACGQRVISVSNLDESGPRINATSSQGPTRDGREKPEVAAPGTNIVAAKGFDPDHLWVEMTGTSMASPYVCGVAGLMLAVDGALTAAQIGGIIRRTSLPLPGVAYRWVDDAGFGVIDAEACVREAAGIRKRKDLTP